MRDVLSTFRDRIAFLLALAITATVLSPPLGAQPRPAIGLTAHGAQLFAEAIAGENAPGTGDNFGFSVAAGDFDDDGADDLAVGIPFNDCATGAIADCGSASVRWGVRNLGLGTETTFLGQTTAGSPNFNEPLEQYGYALAVGDFDGNGRDDLAVGVPGDTFADAGGFPAGAVQLHFGGSGGFSGGQLFLPSVVGWEEYWAHARFGQAVAFGDFNGDHFDDLAIGAWNDGCAYPTCQFGLRNVGSVTVYEGNNTGAMASFDMMLGFDGLPDVAEPQDQLGYALATGDFNGDGYDDLAIGVPAEDDVGAVLVVYGSPWSLLFAVHEYIGQWDLNQTTQPGSRFGEVLAAGDFDGNGYDDLAIGIPGYDGSAQLPDMGLVPVVYGSANGLLGSGRLHWLWEDLLFGSGSSSAHDSFGASLAAGDFNGDGVDDLAAGVKRESGNYGAVAVVAGRRLEGLTGARRMLRPRYFPEGMIPDDQLGIALYGSSVAAGDFDGNGFDDLAAGAPLRRQTVGPLTLYDAGAVAVVYGQLFVDGFETHDAREWSAAVP
jgi:hypothetical protein